MAKSTYKKVEGILVNGSNKYAGGQIYNSTFNMSFNERPLEVTINVVSKDGKFQPPKIDLTEKVDIKFGDLNLKNMYAYKIRKSISTTAGQTLEISFINESFALDKIWVGIPGKHGIFKHQIQYYEELNKDYYEKNRGYTDILNDKKFTKDEKQPIAEMIEYEGEKSSIFLIGRYFHPCDTDKDNQISPKEDKNIDPCDPCPYCPQDKYESKCFELAQTRLFEAGYSFFDLINNWEKIKFSNNIKIEIEKPEKKKEAKDPLYDPYEKYYRDYHGPLREVLTSWASDFGLIWFYDIELNKIKFIDFNSKEIEVDPDKILKDYQEDQLISYELEETAENTTQIACISWYEREGERKNFDCSQSQAISLSPLVGADLIGNRIRSANVADGGTKTLNSENDVIASIYGSYYAPLRDVYWLRDVYEITDADKASNLITTLNFETGFKEDGQPKQENILPEFGDMVILAVVGKHLTLNKSKTKFQEAVQFKLNSLENSLTDSERATYEANSGFFIVAYQNQEFYERILERERLLYSFLGRFHVRENLYRLCGITGTEEFVRNNTSVETADGSAQIYSKREGMDSSPLASFNTVKNGYLGCILSTGNLMSKDDFFKDVYDPEPKDMNQQVNIQGISYQGFKSKDFGQGLYNAELEGAHKGYIDHDQPHVGPKGNNIPIKMAQSVIILDRKAQWVPRPDDFESYRRELANSFFSLLDLKELGNDGQITNSDWTKLAFGQKPEDQLGATQSGMLAKIKIFLAYPGEFETEVNRNKQHPTDRDIYEKKDYETISRRIGGRYASPTKIGLLSSKCAEIVTTINGKNNIIPKIYTPPYVLGINAPGGNKIIEDEYNASKEKKICDNVLGKSIEAENRAPSYKVILTQNFSQTIVLPKIQTGVYSGIKAPDEIMGFSINYNSVSNSEFIAFTGYTGYGCIPNLKYLEKINELYSQYSISNLTPDKSIKLEIKDLPKFKKYEDEIKKGLDSFNLTLSEQGVTCSLSYSTKAARKISEDIMKWKNMVRYTAVPKGQT